MLNKQTFILYYYIITLGDFTTTIYLFDKQKTLEPFFKKYKYFYRIQN